MTDQNDSFEKKTRKVFHPLHEAQSKKSYIYKRLTTLLTHEYFGVTRDFFYDKLCLDVGCGSNGNGSFNLLELGAKHVVACDLDSSFIDPVERMLEKFKGRFTL